MKTKLLPLLCLMFFLASAGQVFAGVVDIGPAADSQVVEGYPNSNYGGGNAMYVASTTGTYKTKGPGSSSTSPARSRPEP